MKKQILFLLLVALFLPALPAQHIVVGAQRTDQYLPLLRKHNVAVVANHSSLIGTTHLVDMLIAKHIKVKRIFCPEHGFRGTAAAGEKVDNSIDKRTKLPIVSLFGKNRKPQPEQLEDIDIVVFDLQDVGCRFYTYISTLHYVMEACAEQGIPLVVLDRPNPNGHYVDGPVLDSTYRSFVGMRPGTPVVYGMTMGEYATMIDSELAIREQNYALHVVKLLNYTHDSIYHLPVPPSPALPTAQSIALYPSLCLLEATTASVGRGTPYPFEVVGYDAQLDLRHAKVKPCFDLRYVRAVMALADTTFIRNDKGFERLAGNDLLRHQLLNGVSDSVIRASWEPALSDFKRYRQQFLLYPEH